LTLDDLAGQFRACTLPHGEWTHTAHLRVGTWHVHHFGADAALALLRTGIRRLNDFHGTPNTETRGYHETITVAYVRLIAEFLAPIRQTAGSKPASTSSSPRRSRVRACSARSGRQRCCSHPAPAPSGSRPTSRRSRCEGSSAVKRRPHRAMPGSGGILTAPLPANQPPVGDVVSALRLGESPQ
jgi:hypothetical protein